MRKSILIDKDGNLQNDNNVLIWGVQPGGGNNAPSQFFGQITLEFFDEIIQDANGNYIPDPASVVTEGLTGTVSFSIWASENAPYPVELTQPDIDISSSCTLLWTGIAQRLDADCQGVTGANYINILVDRN